jgi:hypothetical protein
MDGRKDKPPKGYKQGHPVRGDTQGNYNSLDKTRTKLNDPENKRKKAPDGDWDRDEPMPDQADINSREKTRQRDKNNLGSDINYDQSTWILTDGGYISGIPGTTIPPFPGLFGPLSCPRLPTLPILRMPTPRLPLPVFP